jgi:hypothetical protein
MNLDARQGLKAQTNGNRFTRLGGNHHAGYGKAAIVSKLRLGAHEAHLFHC